MPRKDSVRRDQVFIPATRQDSPHPRQVCLTSLKIPQEIKILPLPHAAYPNISLFLVLEVS